MFVIFKQKTAYEFRISDWSSDVCSSDLSSSNDPFMEFPYTIVHTDPAPSKREEPVYGGHADGPSHEVGRQAHLGEIEIPVRSEERRLGKECVSKCRSRW